MFHLVLLFAALSELPKAAEEPALHLDVDPALTLPPALAPLRRHHGPGTTGAGLLTESGQTLHEGGATVGLRFDYTQFESLSNGDILSRTPQVNDPDPHFEVLRWSFLWTLDVGYGVTDDFELGWSMGFYRGNDLREGHLDMGTPEVHDHGDVSGPTDQWVTAKIRAINGASDHVSLLAGIKLPTGRDDATEENGVDRLDPSLQPGSGAMNFSIGAAYTRLLSHHLTLDASARYTYRGENDHFKIGDRIDVATAVSYRFTEEDLTYPQISVFGELNLVHLEQNEHDNVEEVNSGGTFFFVAPGVRMGVTETTSLFLAVQFPVVQDLNDEQQETDLKVSTGVMFTF